MEAEVEFHIQTIYILPEMHKYPNQVPHRYKLNLHNPNPNSLVAVVEAAALVVVAVELDKLFG